MLKLLIVNLFSMMWARFDIQLCHHTTVVVWHFSSKFIRKIKEG